MPVTLIADSGATKAEWVLINNGKQKTLFTQGTSPYFFKYRTNSRPGTK